MKYYRLGNTDLQISRISLGCMSLPSDEKQATDVVNRALDLGINFFDTADIYADGLNESLLGKIFKQNRSNVLIASKAGNVRRPDGGLDWNPTKQHILESIEGSLKRLDTDYIDLFQLHGGTISDNIDEVIETFELIKKQGKIRNYGISSIRPNVITEYIKRSEIVSVMMQYSLLDRRPEEQCLEMLHDHNIGVLVRGALAQGLLIDKPAKQYLDLPAPTVEQGAKAVKNLSQDERSATHIAIQYVLSHKAVTSAVVGIRTVQQLEDVVAAITANPLTDNELDSLRSSVPALRYREHRID